jgi:hypothetical protein
MIYLCEVGLQFDISTPSSSICTLLFTVLTLQLNIIFRQILNCTESRLQTEKPAVCDARRLNWDSAFTLSEIVSLLRWSRGSPLPGRGCLPCMRPSWAHLIRVHGVPLTVSYKSYGNWQKNLPDINMYCETCSHNSLTLRLALDKTLRTSIMQLFYPFLHWSFILIISNSVMVRKWHLQCCATNVKLTFFMSVYISFNYIKMVREWTWNRNDFGKLWWMKLTHKGVSFYNRR